MKYPVSLVLCLISSALVTGGCDRGDAPSFTDGKYDGILIHRNPSNTTQEVIAASLKSASDHRFSLTIDGNGVSSHMQYEITASAQGLQIAPVESPHSAITLKPAPHQCFESEKNVTWAQLCYDHREVTLDLFTDVAAGTGFTLIIDPRNEAQRPPLEKPASYTKNQLISRAINQSFASRIDFENVVQAKLTARMRTLELLPQFSTNVYTNFQTPGITNFLKVIGDLAPFLLPSRWERARSADSDYDAALDAWITMKADAGSIVEGLVYAILEQEDSIERLQANRALITTIRDQIRDREGTGVAQIGASDDITSIMNSIDESLEQTKKLLSNDFAALAHGAGFNNPEAVADIIKTQAPVSIDNPETLDKGQVSRFALERSYELRQLDSLVQAARKEKHARYFNWLDPNGDTSGHLGFGLPAYVQIESSKVNQLVLEKQQLESLLLEKVEECFNEFQLATQERDASTLASAIDQRRVERITNNMNLGIQVALADLVSALQAKVKDDLLMVTARYRYLIAWSKLNRLLFAGPYSDLARGKLLSPAFDAELENGQN